jgi:hypothetical protein
MIAAAARRRFHTKEVVMTRTSLFVACTLLALGFAATSAEAQTSSRAWVSGKGTDAAGCGLVTAPCRTPQYAFTNIVAAGGEIDILDPAGYGNITITHAISIVNDGVGTAGMLAPAAGNAITINAGSTDAVQLRGLTIEGSGTGYNGIVFNAGGSLTVTNCVAQNFVYDGGITGNGILMQPTSGTMSFVISNTVVSNNAFAGIYYLPPGGTPSANGVIDHVVAANNEFGIDVETLYASAGSTTVAISNSIASNNDDGIFVGGPGSLTVSLTVSIDNTGVSGNGGDGIFAGSTATVLLGRSVITGNAIGVYNGTSPNAFFTYMDNRINANTTNVAGTALLTETLQ